MSKKPSACILDSWALLSFLGDEESGARVSDIISEAHTSGIPLLMTTVNAGEVWYVIARELGASKADDALAQVRNLGIEFRPCDWTLTYKAAQLKSKGKMSYADCFVAALAMMEKGSTIYTGDKELKAVESSVNIEWLG